MKYYKLNEGCAVKYGYFQKDRIYREDARTDEGYPLLNCIRDHPGDWIEIFAFKFGKGYLYKENNLPNIIILRTYDRFSFG
jgi:hypothetical protein